MLLLRVLPDGRRQNGLPCYKAEKNGRRNRPFL